MRVALRHFLFDPKGGLYLLPLATFDRMLAAPSNHRLPRFAGNWVRNAEITVELSHGQPIAVVRSSCNMLTFRNDGTLAPSLSDRHVRPRAELALALGQPIRGTDVEDASTRFLARGGRWSPSPAVRRRIEQTALDRLKWPRGIGI